VLSGYVGAVVSRQVQRGGHVADDGDRSPPSRRGCARLAFPPTGWPSMARRLRQVSVTVAQGWLDAMESDWNDCDRTVVGREWACRP